ncbi:MAG: YraN family protein [Candidatus Nanopelagicales bacterium]
MVPVRAKDVLGQHGEALATEYLLNQGYRILERNWRCDVGEIDILALDGEALVVCEVKTRRTTRYGSPLEAVNGPKARRLRLLAARWLAEHQLKPRTVRIDVVGIVAPADCAPDEYHVEHVRGVL